MANFLRCVHFPSKGLKFSDARLCNFSFLLRIQYICSNPIPRLNCVLAVFSVTPSKGIPAMRWAYGQTHNQLYIFLLNILCQYPSVPFLWFRVHKATYKHFWIYDWYPRTGRPSWRRRSPRILPDIDFISWVHFTPNTQKQKLLRCWNTRPHVGWVIHRSNSQGRTEAVIFPFKDSRY